MRKKIILLLGLLVCVISFGASNVDNIGIIYEEDFRSVGVPEKDIIKAKEIISNASTKHKLLLLDRRQRELEINKYLLESPEKNWNKISLVFDEVGKIEAEILKNKLKSQIEVRKYINPEEYNNARAIAVKRIEENKKKKNENQ
ncbi:hypothetical protein [Ilyobacter polytropus]|uniref:Uncharacterized protein n=1 Tax=Ilyobacter polytropus (strain ATCC 51220 / DSM 2926 / LMG 16218 / CuHBu1) TaxID=572544 RepID=E3HAN7_ILYPC|nr:hypothetical protein [Ilyobacter polytropus]ADO83224.1 conserved hypothetical protein [Ilyobacter polytropus DSM 2926]